MNQVVTTLVLPLLGAAVAAVCLCRLRRSIWETTLRAAWYWSWLPLFTQAGVTICGRGDLSPETLTLLRFSATTSLFCPFMSVLGSKRPHQGAWQFIVASLWCVLNLPVLEVLAYRPAGGLVASDAQSLFLVGLIGLLAVVTLPTRHWLAAFFMVAAQTIWLAPHLPWIHATEWASPAMYGVGFPLAAAAVFLFTVGVRRPSRANLPCDRLWLDFRDTFGALWALRVAERINQEARRRQWDIVLTWVGFRRADGSPLNDSPQNGGNLLAEYPALSPLMRNLLRRFVSRSWMEERLGGEDD